MKPEDFCGAVRRPVAVHEAPQFGQTTPPELETTVPDAEFFSLHHYYVHASYSTGRNRR